jgi:hypothetical protein
MNPGATRRPRDVLRPIVVLRRGERVVASWPLPCGRPDMAVVDQLAHLQLEARRLGCSIRLRNACSDLVELLQFSGLDDVVIADE